MPDQFRADSVVENKKGNRLRQSISLIVSAIVTVGVFSYLFTHITLAEVVKLAHDADPRGVLTFLVLSMSMNVFRTWRYDLVLRSSGYAANRLALFLVVIVRNLFSDLLPARVGSLIYVYLVNQRLGVPLSATTSSFILPFFFDIVAVAPLIMLAALFIDPSSDQSPWIFIGGGIFLIVLVALGLYLLPKAVHWLRSFVANSRRFSEERREKLGCLIAEVEEEIRQTQRTGIYLQLFILSIMVRVTKYGALYVFLFALTSPFGYGFGELHIPKVFLGLCAAEFAASLPISGIAGFGAYEGTWTFIFQLLGFPVKIANLTAVSHHLFTQLYGYLTGALAMLFLMLPYFSRRRASSETKTFSFPMSRFSWSLAVVTAVVIACAFTSFHLAAELT